MLAVSSRAYPAALTILDAIQKIAKERSPDSDVQKKVSSVHLVCSNLVIF
jgi:hypothetical protein